MRWLLTSWGSRGDLHPFLALGRELCARGHAVTLAGHPDWREETEQAGLDFAGSEEPPRGDLLREHPEILSPAWGGLVSLRALVRHAIAPSFEPMLAVLRREAARHDVLVAHHFVFPAPLAAELAGIPWATVALAPGILPTVHAPPGSHYGATGGGALAQVRNRLVWRSGQHLSGRMVDPLVNRLRRAHGLPPVRDAVFSAHSPRLNLQLYSPLFAPLAPDWTAEKRQAGFCFWDPPGATLPPELDAFLREGEPPVLYTLGSTAIHQAGSFYEDAATACAQMGRRGLLLIGDERNRPARLPAKVRAFLHAPYGLVMPRVAAVVHQGGIGTVAQTLRAGRPAVVCPFAFDQPNNARRLQELGVARLLKPGRRTASAMAAALGEILGAGFSARAAAFGEKLRWEDGARRAAEILEETFAG
jgi:UDP:flavonoid glycosyltransferase YjiC (YdhE family)